MIKPLLPSPSLSIKTRVLRRCKAWNIPKNLLAFLGLHPSQFKSMKSYRCKQGRIRYIPMLYHEDNSLTQRNEWYGTCYE